MTDDAGPQILKPGDRLETSRQWLYDAVWSRSLADIAQQLGISVYALKKACGSFAIPLPAPSYRTKLAAGKKPARKKLAADPKRGDRVSILVKAPRPPRPIYEGPLPEVIVERVPAHPHPLVKATAEQLKAAQPDRHRGVRAHKGVFSVRVSPSGIKRAMSILDAFLKAVERNGHEVMPSGSKGIYVVHFELSERVSRKKHQTTPEEVAKRDRAEERREKTRRAGYRHVHIDVPMIPDWDYVPTNEFTFTIQSLSYTHYHRSRVWKDHPSRRLEAMLPEIVIEFGRCDAALKVMHAEAEERARRIEEEAQRERQELERLQTLEVEAALWERVARIRAYVAAVKARAEAEGRADEVKGWCRWASDVADSLDPVPTRLSYPDED